MLKNLIQYYIEIVERDTLEEVSFPGFNEDKDFIDVAGKHEWSTIDDEIVMKSCEFSKQLSLSPSESTLYYGWPISVRMATAKTSGKQYSWIEPLFFLKADYSYPDKTVSLIKEYPKINNSILKRKTSSIEERLLIIEQLGINELDILNEEGLIDIWEKYKSYSPEIHLCEQIGADKLNKTNIRYINDNGFYNNGILFKAKSPRYSRALLRELKQLQEKISTIKGTSMETILNPQSKKRKASRQISKITPLNKSQTDAVSNSFLNNLSVITGPPGTGKSQVVINIITNAFENQKSVLFSSKNNKAVDVVCERIIDRIKFPINLRLGPKTDQRDYTVEFLDLLDSALTGTGDKNKIKEEYELAKDIHIKYKRRYYSLSNKLDQITKVRNKINLLDRDIEKLEKVISKRNLSKLQKVSFKKAPSYKSAKDELNLLKDRKKWSLGKKILGFFSIQLVFDGLHKYCIELNDIIGNIAPLPLEVEDKLDKYEKFLKNFPNFHNYIDLYGKIQKQSKSIPAYSLKKLTERMKKNEGEYIESSINYIEALGRYRISILTNKEREKLASYHSVIRQLSGAYQGNKVYAKLKSSQAKLFNEIKNILPVWSITSLSAGNQFPFKPNLFDLLVIDESSQSDIASALPLLYRSKNAVIIGDPQQLKHIAANLGNNENNELMSKYNLINEEYLRFSYLTQSLFNCARGSVGSENVTLLNEHYRSHFSIIEFSNREWYGGNLEINTNYDNLYFPPEGKDFLEWINVKGNTVRPNNRSALNKIEGEKVLQVLESLYESYSYIGKKPSIGIVTPFNAQGKFYRDRLINIYDEETIRDSILIADTAHKFQGDERDIIIFSPVISHGVHNNSGTINFLRKTSNLFNVSVTRARSILWVVGDKSRCLESGVSYLKNFVEWIEDKKFESLDLPYEGFQSPWEKKLFEVLKAEGFNPIKQQPAGPYFIDIALEIDDSKIAIEVDGEYWHKDINGFRLEKDLIRDSNLELMGWKVLRFWVHELKYYMSDSVKMIKKELVIK